MRAFRFTGDPMAAGSSDPAVIVAFGYRFTLGGDPVAVDADTAERLAANNHFAEVRPDAAAPVPEPPRRGRPRRNG